MLLLIVGLVLVAAQLLVPRRYVLVPLLIATCHVPVILVVPNFPVIRIVMLACLFRALAEGALVWYPQKSPDRWMLVFAASLIVTGLGHSAVDGNPTITRLGLIYDFAGTYLCARAYLKDYSDVITFSKSLAIVLVPLAALMSLEKVTGESGYEILGATFHMVRDGHLRAAGPFGNAILAGTAGATSVPLMLMLCPRDRSYAVVGMLACCVIVLCSSSSGPVMTLIFAMGAWAIWRWRWYVVWIRVGVVVVIVLLHLIMNDPVWYLMARIDITGGSVGYHRAELISQAIKHFWNWWLTGTDYTRDWMPYGVPWSGNHADITNYYLKMGILGGLPLMLTFLGLLACAFRILGRTIRALRAVKDRREYAVWCIGTALATHCFAFLGVAPYDQSYFLFFSIIGAVPALCAWPRVSREKAPRLTAFREFGTRKL